MTSSMCCILDLMISPVTGTVLTDISVESLLRDNHVIMCKLVSAKPRPVQKEIFYCKYATIDMKQFARDLIDLLLVTSPTDDIDSLCEQYMSELLTIIYKHAPVIQQMINVRPRQPWRTDDLQRMRQQVRRAEHKWRHTRLTVHCEIYMDLCDAFKQSATSA